MYKALIVDDEIYVVSLIEKLVDWKSLDIEVIGSASDGIQGLKMVKDLSPDILIADVMMPGFDGITLIKEVREINKDIKVVMISGHKRFEFAKSAIKYNVEDYIMKPIDKHELEQILRKIVKEINDRNIRREEMSEIKERLEINTVMMNTLFMEKLCSGELLNNKQLDLYSINNMYLTDFKADQYIYSCVIIHMAGSNTIVKGLLEEIMHSLRIQVESIFNKTCNNIYISNDYTRLIFLVEYSRTAKQEIKKRIQEAFNLAKEEFSHYPDSRIVLGVGKDVVIHEDIMPLREAIITAEKTINARFVRGYNNPIYYNDSFCESVDVDSILTNDMRGNLRDAIKSASKIEIKKTIESIYDHIQGTQYMNPTFYIDIAWIINSELYEYLQIFQDLSEIKPQLSKKLWCMLAEARSKRDLIEALTKYIFNNVNEIVDKSGNLSNAIRAAKRYIDNNYMNDIQLRDVAKVVNLSQVYFSFLFKEEMGENFISYLSRVRIDASKAMLKDVRKNISEIAEECGYRDVRYFSKVFKRFVGVTPSEYRKRLN